MRGTIVIVGSVLSVAQAYEGPAPSELREQREIYLGVEALSGYRTDYIYKGERLAEGSMEFQLSGGIATSENWYIQGEIFHLRECETANFSQTQLQTELNYYLSEESTLGYIMSGQWFEKARLKNGTEQGIVWRWNPSLEQSYKAQITYDTGQEGAYAELRATYMPLVTDSIAWVNTAQLGMSLNYAQTDGIKEIMLRSGFRWAVNEAWQIEPYAAWYYGVGKDDFSRLSLGIWATYSF